VAVAELPAIQSGDQRADGTLVIDLTRLVPQPVEECAADAPDPFSPEIVVCETSAPSPRLGPMVGPVDDGFGSAIPRARIKLSDTASAEANVHNAPVGGVNANGGEVRLKIDF
jgi:hypothetical protein